MKTNDEVRRANLLIAIKRVGNAAKLAAAVGTAPAYISQIKNRTADSKTGVPKMMGDDMARRIETALGESIGWIDQDHGSTEEAVPEVPEDSWGFAMKGVRSGGDSDTVAVKRVKLRLSAGLSGFETEPYPDDGGVLPVPTSAIEALDLVPHCLLAIQVKGRSMEPMIFEDDWVVINIADTKMINKEIYAVNFNGEALVKQLVYRGGNWYLHSINPDHGPINIRSGQISIVGRFVYQPGRVVTGRL